MFAALCGAVVLCAGSGVRCGLGSAGPGRGRAGSGTWSGYEVVQHAVVQVHGGAGTRRCGHRAPEGAEAPREPGATGERRHPGGRSEAASRQGAPLGEPPGIPLAEPQQVHHPVPGRKPGGGPSMDRTSREPSRGPPQETRGTPPREGHPRKDDTPRGVPVGTRGTSSRKRPDGDRPRGSPRGRLPHRETPEDTPWNVLPREALRGSPRGSPPERIPEGRPRRTSPGRSALGPPPDNAPAGSAGGRLWNVAPGRPRGAVPWITPVGWPAGMGPVGLAPGSPVGGRRRSGAEGGDPRGFPAGHRPKASP